MEQVADVSVVVASHQWLEPVGVQYYPRAVSSSWADSTHVYMNAGFFLKALFVYGEREREGKRERASERGFRIRIDCTDIWECIPI